MKTKILALVVALAAIVAMSYAATPVVVTLAEDGGIAMLVRYVGSATSATVAVDAGTGDLTFQTSAAAYTGFECPVSAPLGGVIDVSNAACDTMGEVVDTINGNCTGCSSDFRAVLIDSLRTDSSNDTLVTIGATQVTRTDGLPLNIDTSVALLESRALVPNRSNIAGYLGGPPNYRLLENPHGGQTVNLQWFEGYSTYGSGTSNFYVYSVKPSNKTAGASTVTQLWGPEVMGNSATNKQFTYWQTNNLPGRPNEKLIVRVVNSAAMGTSAGFALGQLNP